MRGALLLAVTWIVPLGHAAEPAAALPPSTLAYLSIDVGRAVRELPRLELVELLEDEEVADFLSGAVGYARRETRMPRAALKLLEMYGLPDIVEGRVVVALLGFGVVDEAGAVRWGAGLEEDARTRVGDVVLIVETSGAEAFGTAVGRALELVPEPREQEDVEDGPFPHRVTRFPSLDGPLNALRHGFVGDTFVAALHADRYLEVAAAVAAGGREGGALEGDDAFAAWRAASPRGEGVVDLYLGARALRESLGARLERELAGLAALGLTSIEGAGLSVGVRDGRLRDSIALVTGGERTGLLALLDALRPGGIAAEVPAGVDLALALRLDPAVLLDRLTDVVAADDPAARQEMAARLDALGAELGIDARALIEAVGDRMAVWSTARSLLVTEGGASVALRDGATVAEALASLAGRVDFGPDVAVKPFELEGASAAYYVSGGLPVSPAVAVLGDRLVAATSPPQLKRRIASPDGDGGGFLSDDDVARCMAQNVGQGVEDVVALFYLDLAHATELGLASAGPFLPMVAMQAPFELDPTLMPLPDTVAWYLSGYLLTLRANDRVVALDASSPLGGLILSTSAFAAAQWSIEKYEEQRARERARVLEPR